MGLLNSNQVLKGARTAAGTKTYAQIVVLQQPTYTVAGSVVTFTGGVVEVEGEQVSLTGMTFDLADAGSLITSGQKFVLAAVPSYEEPLSRSAAETAGLNYYVGNTVEGETVAYSFIPSEIEQAVVNKGGATALATRVYNGTASTADITVFNMYSEALERLRDPRYALAPLPVKADVDFILAEVVDQSNAGNKVNALLTKTQAEFNMLRSQLPDLYVERLVHTQAEAVARYAGRYFLIKSAVEYSTLNDAINDTNGTPKVVSSATDLTAGKFYAVFEYNYPSNTALGQEGNEPKVLRFISKKEVASYGRVNPIYMYNEMPVRVANNAYSRLTLPADPAPLLRITAGASSAVTVDKVILDRF